MGAIIFLFILSLVWITIDIYTTIQINSLKNEMFKYLIDETLKRYADNKEKQK